MNESVIIRTKNTLSCIFFLKTFLPLQHFLFPAVSELLILEILMFDSVRIPYSVNVITVTLADPHE